MKISTKGRYALRLMLDLATYNTGEPISLNDVAKRQEVSEKYLEQIISILNRGGLVKSSRGAKGGYSLRHRPEEITVGMILRLTEGDLAPVACVSDDNSAECSRIETCVTARVYKKINEAITGVVDGITLADMKEWQDETIETYSI